MREVPFRSFAQRHLSGSAPSSYLSNCRMVERRLGVDLDVVELADTALLTVRDRLKSADVPSARISDTLSALRLYRRFCESSGSFDTVPIPPEVPTTVDVEDGGTIVQPLPSIGIENWVSGASTVELLRASSTIIAALRDRGVVRTGNGPVGDYAELLFSQALGWELTANSTAGHDAIDRAGIKFQIKARRRGGAGYRQLGVIRNLEQHRFDMLAAILFAPDFAVERALLIPHAVVAANASWVEHTKGWRLMLSENLAATPGVRDVTDVVAGASAAFDAPMRIEGGPTALGR